MDRKTANFLRGILDNWLPPVLRESTIFDWLFKLWLGPKARSNFKKLAFRMDDKEYAAAYQSLGGRYETRETDTTERQMEWVLNSIRGQRVLEIGPGKGALTKRLVERGYQVSTLDLFPGIYPPGDNSIKRYFGIAEKFQFPDKSFDTVVIAMVIEHVRNITSATLELERITRERVLIVTPEQRYYRVTFDYHLHFFYSLDHLASHIPRGKTEGAVIDGDLCLKWDVDEQPSRTNL